MEGSFAFFTNTSATGDAVGAWRADGAPAVGWAVAVTAPAESTAVAAMPTSAFFVMSMVIISSRMRPYRWAFGRTFRAFGDDCSAVGRREHQCKQFMHLRCNMHLRNLLSLGCTATKDRR